MTSYVPPPHGFPGVKFEAPPELAPPIVSDVDQARREIRDWGVQRLADVLEFMSFRACSHPGRWSGKATCGDQCHLTPDERLIYNALVRELEDRQSEVVRLGIYELRRRTPGLHYQYVSNLVGDVYEGNANFEEDWYIGHSDWWRKRLGLGKSSDQQA